ncbi:transporter [Lithospermum erythrorhizon]|uniref:Protein DETOXIFICATION n=1 Tax=Lithospermum erythrorhizon TaxID=34254 RepID=A0AAV3QIN2_LITER
MASHLPHLHQILFTPPSYPPNQTTPNSKPHFKPFINPGLFKARFRIIPRCSLGEKKPTILSNELKYKEKNNDPDSGSPGSGSGNESSVVVSGNVDGVILDVLSIALPAAVALAAEPVTSLVDTAFVGHIGSVELAAVGVSVSVYNLVSKLFNVPLLNITTSFVAEEQALITDGDLKSGQILPDSSSELHRKILMPSVSTSLALAGGLGLAEAVALTFGSGFLMNVMGISADSPMRLPAEQYLTLRAFGTVPIVIALAAQGTFRGFKDTKTPLYAVGAGNIVNCVLDPIFIFVLDLGVGGAAIATVISEFLTALILLLKLNEKVSLVAPNINGGRIARYLRSGALLTVRSLAVLVTMTLATSMAAREGPIPMAGYQICIEIWLALSLINDALALAGQALLATDYSQGNYNQARKVVYKVLQIGLLMGGSMAIILFISFGALSGLFSTDSDVLQASRSGTLVRRPYLD